MNKALAKRLALNQQSDVQIQIEKRGNMELTQAEYHFLKYVLTNTVDWVTFPPEHVRSLQSILVKLDNAML
jgi:hypothetical protein